jgi:hypothetical protein
VDAATAWPGLLHIPNAQQAPDGIRSSSLTAWKRIYVSS